MCQLSIYYTKLATKEASLAIWPRGAGLGDVPRLSPFSACQTGVSFNMFKSVTSETPTDDYPFSSLATKIAYLYPSYFEHLRHQSRLVRFCSSKTLAPTFPESPISCFTASFTGYTVVTQVSPRISSVSLEGQAFYLELIAETSMDYFLKDLVILRSPIQF